MQASDSVRGVKFSPVWTVILPENPANRERFKLEFGRRNSPPAKLYEFTDRAAYRGFLQAWGDKPNIAYVTGVIDEHLISEDGLTIIRHNGSKWAGELPDDLDSLVDCLLRYDLRLFDLHDTWRYLLRPGEWHGGYWKYSGNFEQLSNGFGVWTRNPAVDAELARLIRANINRRLENGVAVTSYPLAA